MGWIFERKESKGNFSGLLSHVFFIKVSWLIVEGSRCSSLTVSTVNGIFYFLFAKISLKICLHTFLENLEFNFQSIVNILITI